jgi:aminodeoxyfutalosine synthase
MTALQGFEELLHRVTGGDRLSADDVTRLAAADDILSTGMLADAVRRNLHGTTVTYARVAGIAFDGLSTQDLPNAASELRVTGAPSSIDAAVAAVAAARRLAGDRTVSGYAWTDLENLAKDGGCTLKGFLEELRRAGLDAVAEVPIDTIADLPSAAEALLTAGYDHIRLTIDKTPGVQRVPMLVEAAQLHNRLGCVKVLNPLPMRLAAFRPTTGYDDVKMVAIARLAAPTVPTIQVDWLRYGPKLAQVALTFGADDLDNVSPSDEAPDGRRRAPVAELRRNVEAAGFSPVERDGRFAVLTR